AHYDGEPGGIRAGTREAGHVTAADRVRVTYEDDGNPRGRSLGRTGIDRSRCDDEIDLEADELVHQAGEPVESPFGPAIFDDNVLSFDPTQIAQALPKRFERIWPHGRRIPDKADAVNLSSLLRPDRQRLGEKAAHHGRKECSARGHANHLIRMHRSGCRSFGWRRFALVVRQLIKVPPRGCTVEQTDTDGPERAWFKVARIDTHLAAFLRMHFLPVGDATTCAAPDEPQRLVTPSIFVCCAGRADDSNF